MHTENGACTASEPWPRRSLSSQGYGDKRWPTEVTSRTYFPRCPVGMETSMSDVQTRLAARPRHFQIRQIHTTVDRSAALGLKRENGTIYPRCWYRGITVKASISDVASQARFTITNLHCSPINWYFSEIFDGLLKIYSTVSHSKIVHSSPGFFLVYARAWRRLWRRDTAGQ